MTILNWLKNKIEKRNLQMLIKKKITVNDTNIFYRTIIIPIIDK